MIDFDELLHREVKSENYENAAECPALSAGCFTISRKKLIFLLKRFVRAGTNGRVGRVQPSNPNPESKRATHSKIEG
jgi:hypothetical protein